MTEKLDKTDEEGGYFQEFATFQDVPAEYNKRRCLKDTMFSSFYDPETVLSQLPKCLRVLPHDQNTSGFFITIIRKTKDFDHNVTDLEGAEAVVLPPTLVAPKEEHK